MPSPVGAGNPSRTRDVNAASSARVPEGFAMDTQQPRTSQQDEDEARKAAQQAIQRSLESRW